MGGAPLTSPPVPQTFQAWALGWIKSIAAALVIWIVLRSYVIEAFRIPSGSMENTLLIGDFLFVNKAAYGGELEIPLTGLRFLRLPGYAEPQRGTVVIFRSVEDSTPNLDIVKRVIGAPGDTLQMVHDTVMRNGRRFDLLGEIGCGGHRHRYFGRSDQESARGDRERGSRCRLPSHGCGESSVRGQLV